MAIFVDLDGVLVDNVPMIRTQYTGYLNKYDVPVDWTLFTADDWANAPKSKFADDLMAFVLGYNIDVCILSEAVSHAAFEGKSRWMVKNFPGIDYAFCSGSKKHFTGFLIDDKPDQEFGGVRVLAPAFHNERKDATMKQFRSFITKEVSRYVTRSSKGSGQHCIPKNLL